MGASPRAILPQARPRCESRHHWPVTVAWILVAVVVALAARAAGVKTSDDLRRSPWPRLASGSGFGEHVGEAVPVTDDVQSVVIPGVGHFVGRGGPDEMLAVLAAFLAPYRDRSAAAQDPRPPAAAGSGR
jgi:hypothetical protein